MKTLRTADHQRIYPQLRGAALMAGFYLNELILKLVQKDDPHEGLFDAYALTIESLAQLSPVVARDLEATLRGFELTLLEELGYGLTLTHEADSDTQIDPAATYHYALERGPVRIDDASAQRAAELGALAGRTLIALAQRELSDATVLVQAKQLMRRVISHHLGEKSLHTRLLVRELK
jgi:DNA repair protein RecO (recombination protein O)